MIKYICNWLKITNIKLDNIYFLVLIISSCAPKVIINNTRSDIHTKDFESFVVFEISDTIKYSQSQVVGEIKIKDSGLTVNCDYVTIINIAVEKAKTLGRKTGESKVACYFPFSLKLPTKAIDIACGREHCLAKGLNHVIYSWGSNSYGQVNTP